jgi:hypothetical protein
MAEYESTLANVKGGITKHNAIDQSRLIEVLRRSKPDGY